MTETAIKSTLMRGGTSKGVFVEAGDLPPSGRDRDRFILALLGSPDPMQIDGLGGTHSSTSKLMAVARSTEAGIDVDYLFAQISIDEAVVDYQGNCGNLTTAIAPFALAEGLVPPSLDLSGASTTVMLRNLNTGIRVRAQVPLANGCPAVEGDLEIAGVPGTGPAITTDYLDPGASVLDAVLPTGNATDKLDLGRYGRIEASIVDVTSPHAYVRAVDVDLGDLDQLERIRSACGALVGLASPAIPRLVIAGPSGDTSADIEAKAISMQRLHHAFPMTGALCTAAAAKLAGTIANEVAAHSDDRSIRLRHPKGVVAVRAEVDGELVLSVGVTRTARRLFRGDAFVVGL